MDETKVITALEVYRKCVEAQKKTEGRTQQALEQLRVVAENSTFSLSDQWYQIRERQDRLYLCELNGKPKGRPKKTAEQKARDKAERDAAPSSGDIRREPNSVSTGATRNGSTGEVEPLSTTGAEGGDRSPRRDGTASSPPVLPHAAGDLGEDEEEEEEELTESGEHEIE